MDPTMIDYPTHHGTGKERTLHSQRMAPLELLPVQSVQDLLNERDFLLMTRAFQATGGLCCGDDLAQRLGIYTGQPISKVARWIVSREVVSFQWNCQTMLPIFQFDPSGMRVRPNVVAILRELSDVFDDWGCAVWFAQPNVWLADRVPVDLMDTEALAVLDAARVDRFIACG